MSVGIKIKEIRKRIGITQERLADLIGVSLMTVRRWEWGNTSPSASMLPKLAEALNTSVEYLMGLTDDAPPETPLKQLLENLTKSLPIKEKEKITDPLLGTEREYDPNTPQELNMAYWGGVLNNARRLVKSGTEQEKAAALMMLRMAVDAITGSEGKQTEKRGANIHADIIDNSGNVKQTISTVT